MSVLVDVLFLAVGALLILIGWATWRQDRDQRRTGQLVRGRVVETGDGSSVVEYVDGDGAAHRYTEPASLRKGATFWVRRDPDDATFEPWGIRGPSAWFHWVFLLAGVGLLVLTAVLVVRGVESGIAGT